MSNYRRNRVSGGTYFFTVNLANRRSDLLVREVETLRACICAVRLTTPFHIDSWVILPDHMHCIWTLPEDDTDYSGRLWDIKVRFSKALPAAWPYSTFEKCVALGRYDPAWAVPDNATMSSGMGERS
jgi:putative transposase